MGKYCPSKNSIVKAETGLRPFKFKSRNKIQSETCLGFIHALPSSNLWFKSLFWTTNPNTEEKPNTTGGYIKYKYAVIKMK